jgi:YidC/Oxa1 family membrane protein insertase
MDNQRLLLFIALAFVLMLLWQAWQQDYGHVAQPVAQQTVTPAGEPAAPPPAASAGGEDLPGITRPAQPAAAAASTGEVAPVLQTGREITVQTDLYRIVIDAHGGDLRQADLLRYPSTGRPDSPPFRLLNGKLPDLFVVQSGLRTDSGVEPTHHVVYTVEQDSYRMGDHEDSLVVPLLWRSPQGVEVVKRYIFHRGSYVIDIEHLVNNHGTQPWTGRQYEQLQRTPATSVAQNKFVHTYIGGVVYSPEEKYEKIKFDDMKKHALDRTITAGWAAMVQHYFVGALIPDTSTADHYYTRALDDSRYVIGMIAPERSVAPGASAEFRTRLYLGPKLQGVMKKIAPGLELTVDYGKLTVLAEPVFWLLKTIHDLLGNWGWSIIIVTMLIKLAFYKLSETSYRSMANMRKLAPRMKSLKERYGDDRQKLNQAMMEMYKKEKINPLGGCLPIVVQIPVFIALYWVLLESVELRQAPFILWIHDLSAPDPFYILPLLMGVTMLIQQKLNPAPVDPIQAKVMMVLPFVFGVFFAFFPSGLVLYWVVNNTLSITQQSVITRRIERGGK